MVPVLLELYLDPHVRPPLSVDIRCDYKNESKLNCVRWQHLTSADIRTALVVARVSYTMGFIELSNERERSSEDTEQRANGHWMDHMVKLSL